MSIVVIVKTVLATGPIPTVNIWWLHTIHPMNAMMAPASTTVAYPKRGLRENTGNTSETIPIAGKIKMYTSGCPKTQKRCCHKTTDPPFATLKKLNAKYLSKVSSIRATVITGKAKTKSIAVMNDIHVNRGNLIHVIPGALKLIIVTMKLNAEPREATPSTCKLSIQKSIPLPGFWSMEVRGAYPNHPASVAPPIQLNLSIKAPPKKVQ